MGFTKQQLKDELTTSPRAATYAPHITSGNHSELARLLNVVDVTIDIDREVIPSYEIFEAINPTHWDEVQAASPAQMDKVRGILSMGQVNVKGDNTRLAFTTAFAGKTSTLQALSAIQTRKGSRAEKEWAAGDAVTTKQISDALAL